LNFWVSGFVDGEGSFSVAIIKHPAQRKGWMINPVFQVYQHERHREVLELMQYVFKTGRIYRKSGVHPVLNFSIDSRRNLIERVIPFFDQYPLVVKQAEYQKFRRIVMLMEERRHFDEKGFTEIVNLAFSMNQQGKGRKYTKEQILTSWITHQDTIKNPQRLHVESRGGGNDIVQTSKRLDEGNA
jgi:hypothetical protein